MCFPYCRRVLYMLPDAGPRQCEMFPLLYDTRQLCFAHKSRCSMTMYKGKSGENVKSLKNSCVILYNVV